MLNCNCVLEHLPYEVYYLIATKVKLQRGDVARLPAAADVSQLQLEVVPPTICHLNLVQTQTHWSGGTAGDGEHQLTVAHL